MQTSKNSFSKLSATLFALFGACTVQLVLAAGPSQPITTMPVPGLPTGVAVCMQPCKALATSMPVSMKSDGTFQITGLAAGKYEVTPPAYPMHVYTVGSNGVFKWQVNAVWTNLGASRFRD